METQMQIIWPALISHCNLRGRIKWVVGKRSSSCWIALEEMESMQRRQKIGKALLQKIMLLSIWVHSCIFSQDLGCWDRFACEYLTTILHHFGSVNAWILQLPTAICGPTSGLWCGVLLILVFVAYVADGKKWKWLLRKTGERARLEEEVGSSLTCLHCFFCLTNSSSLAESLKSVFAGTIMLSDFGCCM